MLGHMMNRTFNLLVVILLVGSRDTCQSGRGSQKATVEGHRAERVHGPQC